jgi:hypothetical protein
MLVNCAICERWISSEFSTCLDCQREYSRSLDRKFRSTENHIQAGRLERLFITFLVLAFAVGLLTILMLIVHRFLPAFPFVRR